MPWLLASYSSKMRGSGAPWQPRAQKSDMRLRLGVFHVGVELRNRVPVALFDNTPFQLHRVRQFPAGECEILVEQRESLGLFVLREIRGEALDFAPNQVAHPGIGGDRFRRRNFDSFRARLGF